MPWSAVVAERVVDPLEQPLDRIETRLERLARLARGLLEAWLELGPRLPKFATRALQLVPARVLDPVDRVASRVESRLDIGGEIVTQPVELPLEVRNRLVELRLDLGLDGLDLLGEILVAATGGEERESADAGSEESHALGLTGRVELHASLAPALYDPAWLPTR